jgi:hypothetical protein
MCPIAMHIGFEASGMAAAAAQPTLGTLLPATPILGAGLGLNLAALTSPPANDKNVSCRPQSRPAMLVCRP